jgi:hypothetical protein
MSCTKFGRYLEGQGHSMTLKQNPARPITSLMKSRILHFLTEMITVLRQRVALNKVKVTA